MIFNCVMEFEDGCLGVKMNFIDLESQYERIRDDVNERVLNVLSSQSYIMGPEIAELEEKLAHFVGTKYAFTCGSGTDALVISLMALGINETDAVFVPSFTFFASAESITLAGGVPIFVDVDPRSFNIDPDDLQRRIDEVIKDGKLNPRGVVAVDLFGRIADYERIGAIADKYDLFVVEDACQSFGAQKNGKRAGSFGDIAATSFFPAKPLGCYGDGGAIFTNSDDLARLVQSIRVHGQGKDKYDNIRIGVNGRFDTLQAAIVLAKLEIFEDELEARAKIADYYTKAGLGECLETPFVDDDEISAWAQYTLKARDEVSRKSILAALTSAGIPSAIYYPIPIHQSTAYKNMGYDVSLPVTEELASRVFSIPMHPYLEVEDMDGIVTAIKAGL